MPIDLRAPPTPRIIAYLKHRENGIEELKQKRRSPTYNGKFIVICPECSQEFQGHRKRRNNGYSTIRTSAKSILRIHFSNRHPKMSVRQRSLAADKAVEGL